MALHPELIQKLLGLYNQQPLTPDRLPYTDEIDYIWQVLHNTVRELGRDWEVRYGDIYETLMRLRKQGKLEGKGRPTGRRRTERRDIDEGLVIRLFESQSFSVDKLPYTNQMDFIFEAYNRERSEKPRGYSELYGFLLNLRKTTKKVNTNGNGST